MPPPANKTSIAGPCLIPDVIKEEEITVRTLRAHISPLRIFRLLVIDPFPVHPLIERTAVIKHAVNDHPHPPAVHLLHKPGKKFIDRLQIQYVACPDLIFLSMYIIQDSLRQRFPTILHDLPIMRIYVIIVLRIILVVGRGNK